MGATAAKAGSRMPVARAAALAEARRCWDDNITSPDCADLRAGDARRLVTPAKMGQSFLATNGDPGASVKSAGRGEMRDERGRSGAETAARPARRASQRHDDDWSEVKLNPSDEMRQLQLAYRLYQSSQVKDAYKLLQGIVRNNKRNYHAMHLLGIIELNNGNPSGIEYLERSLEIEPPNPDFIENYAKTLRAVGNVKEAHRVCDHGLELFPRRPALLHMKAITACELGLIEESIEILDRLLAANPNNWQCLNDKAIALSKSGDLSKVVECLDRAIALNPNFATAHNNRGNALKRLWRFDDALSSFDRAVALRPDYAEAFCNRANTLRDIGRFEEAVVAYDKTIALAPHSADAPYNKGLCVLAMGNYREGFRLIEYRSAP